jgi:Ca-activated chloride channel family protein
MLNRLAFITLLMTGYLFWSGFDIDTAREANQAYQADKYEQAIELYQQAIDQQPNNPKLYFNLGNAYAKAGRVNDALGAYEQFKAISEDPADDYKADYNMGRVLSDAQQYGKAMDYYKQALRRRPDDQEAKYNYELALKKKQEQQQQQNQDQQNQNSDQNKNQQQQNQDQNQNQNQRNQQQQQDQNSQQQNNQQQQQQNSGEQQNQQGEQNQDQQQRAAQQKLSKQEAQQILKALEKKEKDLLKRFKKVKAESDKTNENDW